MKETVLAIFQLLLSSTRGPFGLPLEAPFFLWIGSAGLLCSQIFVLTRYKIKASKLSKAFKSQGAQILDIQREKRHIDGFGLEQLRSIMEADPRLKDSWWEFNETILHFPNDKVYNTRQAEEFFKEENLIATRINSRFYSAFPGLLTSVGLLLTFSAILVGLSHIRPDAQGRLSGVEDLVYSLSGKFVSSIVALLSAAVFTWFDKSTSKNLHTAYQRFVSALNKRLARMPAERLLQVIQDNNEQQANAIRGIATDLADPITRGVQEGMGPLVERIALAIEELNRQKREAVSESFGDMLKEFKASLVSSTGDEFKALAKSIESTTSLISHMSDAQEQTKQRTEEMIKNFDSFLGRQHEAAEQQLGQLTKAMERVMESLSVQAAQSSSAFGSSVDSVLSKLAEATTEQISQSARQNTEISQALSGVLSQLQETSRSSVSTMEQSMSNVLEETRNLRNTTSEKMVEIISQQAQNAASISEARQALQDSITLFKEAVGESARSLELIGSGADGMQSGLQALDTSIEKASRIQESTTAVSSMAETRLRELTQVYDLQKNVLDQYERTFSVLDKNTALILDKIGEQLGNYSRLVKDGLETHLEQFDDALGNATGKLANTVRGLSDSLDTLMEVVENTLNSLTRVANKLEAPSRNLERTER
jgi:hypothetical protein